MQIFNNSGVDHFSQDYRVYIEGIQVPFESVHISNVYGKPPEATITLPPWPGLQELGKNYAPKVYVFWRDYNYAMTTGERAGEVSQDDEIKDSYKQIYHGVITSVSDSKEISPDGGGQSISLSCMHPIAVLQDILLRFANQAVTAEQAQIDIPAEGSIRSSQWDVNLMMFKALGGIDQSAADGDLRHVPEGKYEDLKGTPGVIRVLWNILKSDASRNRNGEDSQALVQLFIPLIESGLKFWKRMAGHPDIEEGIQTTRVDVKASSEDSNNDSEHAKGITQYSGEMMIPGAFRTFIGTAAQKEMAVAALNSVSNGMGSPEAVSFLSIIDRTLEVLEYDMVTLASPISKADGGIIEYLVKPMLPYYYAPICNVVLPNMLSNISVTSDYDAIPTRSVNLTNWTALITAYSSGGSPSQQYTAPHSVRYARAGGENGSLETSLSAYNNNVGRYEWGRGVKSITSHLPPKYNILQTYLDKVERDDESEQEEQTGREQAAEAWEKSYTNESWPGIASYNPLKRESGISAFQRMNFLFVDHDFAMETAKARTAQAAGCFNPYAVVGYPMDIIDPVPSRESYHGLCTSVTHTIHASGSATTSYGLTSAITFSELASYNLPAVNPYLTYALNFQNDLRLYRNTDAYKKACAVYLKVFGIGASEPALLQDYSTGTPLPFARDSESGCWVVTKGEEGAFGPTEAYKTQSGSLWLVARNITSLLEVETDMGVGNFIHISDWAGKQTGDITSEPNTLRVEIVEGESKISTPGLDAESSPFLTY